MIGTWRLAIHGLQNIYLATNSGDLFIGKEHFGDSLVFCSEPSIIDITQQYKFIALKKNTLLEIRPDCTLVELPLTKKI